MGSKLEGLPKTALAEAEEPVLSQQAAALLADQVVLNIYRKVAQHFPRCSECWGCCRCREGTEVPAGGAEVEEHD